MLETIREYALERLEHSGDLDITRRRHAEFYAALAERVQGQLRGPEHLALVHRLEAELDNLRAALSWSLDRRAGDTAGGERSAIGLRLVQALAQFWYEHGHASEGRRWLQRAIELVSDEDAGAPLGQVAHWLGALLQQQGENDLAVSFFERSLAIWRDLGDRDKMARELNSLGITHSHLGHPDTARSLLADSISIARELGGGRLAAALTSLGHVESSAGNVDLAIRVLREALAIDRAHGDMLGVAIDQQSLAVASLRAGRAREAHHLLAETIDYVISSGDTEFLANTLELSAAVAAHLQAGLGAARLAGAAEGVRQRMGMPIPERDAAMVERFLAPARAAIARDMWEAELTAGHALSQQQAASLLVQQASADTPA
jgi:tetratricopeptide (TPR) repeat protein